MLKRNETVDEDVLYEMTHHVRKVNLGIFGSFQHTLAFKGKETYEAIT